MPFSSIRVDFTVPVPTGRICSNVPVKQSFDPPDASDLVS